MTPEEQDAFLRETRIAKLVTLHADGSPTVVPVWFEWDGAEARVFTSATSPKVRRMRADPRVALTVEEGVGIPERWVTIEGTATIEHSGGWELARRLAPRYYAPERCTEALAGWEKIDWVVLRIAPKRIVSER